MSIEERQYTLAEFERIIKQAENADRLLELINGEIVEKVLTELHGIIVTFLLIEIGIYLRRNPIGRVVTEVRHQQPDQQSNSRVPDISYTSKIRIAERENVVTRGAVPQMPDLAIEVQSPDQSADDLREKAAYYLAHGTLMVWLVFPLEKRVEVITADNHASLDEVATLSGGEVLPGLMIPVGDIFSEGG